MREVASACVSDEAQKDALCCELAPLRAEAREHAASLEGFSAREVRAALKTFKPNRGVLSTSGTRLSSDCCPMRR